MTKIAVCGSAGRREDSPKMSPELYQRVMRFIDQQALKDIPVEQRDIVSGGAAWADHMAISLFHWGKCKNLTLHLPANWDSHNKCYDEGTGYQTPGRTTNYLHRQFSRAMNLEPNHTLQSIDLAFRNGAAFYDGYGGFKPRNLAVGQVDLLLAFTWHEGDTPKPGSGTIHCWNNSEAQRIHFNLGDF